METVMKWWVAIAILGMATLALAQVSVDVSGLGVKVQTGKGGSVASNTAGTIDPDVQMDGVAVINGEVFVDGEKVPKGKSPYTSKKSGKTYVIKWEKDGNVAIQEK
jgi:hypothetical protein